MAGRIVVTMVLGAALATSQAGRANAGCLVEFACKLMGIGGATPASAPAQAPVARRVVHRQPRAVARDRAPSPVLGGNVHLIVAKGITSVADLSGAQVSFGAAGSASQAAGRKVFASMGIRVHEQPLDLDNALDGLSTGNVAAIVVVAPSPDVALGGVGRSGARLLSMPPEAVPLGMKTSTIAAASYPVLTGGHDVRTFAVGSRRLAAIVGARAFASLADR